MNKSLRSKPTIVLIFTIKEPCFFFNAVDLLWYSLPGRKTVYKENIYYSNLLSRWVLHSRKQGLIGTEDDERTAPHRFEQSPNLSACKIADGKMVGTDHYGGLRPPTG
jgi:hypothetical protein